MQKLSIRGSEIWHFMSHIIVPEKNTYYIQECDHFFRSCRSTADLLTVVSDTIVRAFNRSGATRPQALYISKAFDRVLYAGLLYKLKSCEISGQKFGLFRLENFRFEILSFLSNRALNGSGWELFAKISTKYGTSSRLHSFLYSFPIINYWPPWWFYL